MTNQSDWSPCESGTLSDLKKRLSREASAGQWTRRGVLAAGVAAVAGGTWLIPRNEPPGGLTCAQVKEFADAYVHNELASDVLQQINAHRSHCRACDSQLKEMERRQNTV